MYLCLLIHKNILFTYKTQPIIQGGLIVYIKFCDKTYDVIVKELEMTNCVCVTLTPNKPNIRYSVIANVEDDCYTNFKWLIDEL